MVIAGISAEANFGLFDYRFLPLFCPTSQNGPVARLSPSSIRPSLRAQSAEASAKAEAIQYLSAEGLWIASLRSQ
ncbi:hypothetical protein [Bradyrhizobium sp. CCBAU 45389]|uniref:hypothetical protein n=1 Tax=Bradyrhizobium sp. CCBAU 45389 TaxID=858429 RepID=UPI00230642A2|nr:hypothetical protein [Bradyrhizobium sp. CCBAU 45389]